MSNLSLFVGLDYHQDGVQVCVLDPQGKVLLNRSAANDWQAVQRIVQPLGIVQRVGIEACCGAADFAEELVERAGWNVSLGHPAYIAKLKGSPDKSDYTDGRMLADLTRVGYLPLVWLAPARIRELRQLVHHRQQLVDHRRALKLRIGGLLREQRVKIAREVGSRWTKAWIASVKDNSQFSTHAAWIAGELLEEIAHAGRKIALAEARLRQASAGDAVIERLMQQEGIGEVTAWVLRAFVGEFARFKSGKHLARYCGLSPCNRSSGAKQADAGLIDGCNKLLRQTIVQAAHRLINQRPRWSQLAESMRRRGKAANVIVAAVGNRWLRKLHHAMKDPQPQQPQPQQPQPQMEKKN